MISTDVAHIVLFHPDDLAHAREWPIAWYSETFVFPTESAAGRLVAWCTGSDGGFAVRVTDGGVTDRERRYAGPSWTFPYIVRHGRVFLDNTDTLPGEEQMTQTSDNEDHWVDVPNGDYVVTVTAIEWNAEPGAHDDLADKLPNYVVQFHPGSPADTKPAKRPPDLVCLAEAVAGDEIYVYAAKPPEPMDFDLDYPAFASAEVTRAGQDFSTQGEAPIEAAVATGSDTFAIFDLAFVVGAELSPGAVAVIAACHGSGGIPDEAMRYSFRALQAVQISEIAGVFIDGRFEKLGTTGFFRRQPKPVPAHALAAVRIRPLAMIDDISPASDPSQLRARILGDLRGGGPLAKQLGGLAEYEALRLEASEGAQPIALWLIDHLPLSARERLSASILPPNRQQAVLSDTYAAYCGGRG